MPRCLLVLVAVVLAAAGPSQAGPLVPDDPYYASHQWYGPVLNLPEAWGYSLGSTLVTVAILDTGVMTNTPDLAGRLLAPLSGTGVLPLDGTTHHHGTWVASVAAMGVNNGVGGAGVGNFSILPITVTGPLGNNQADFIAEGIRVAAAAGARVINISHSTTRYDLLDAAAGDALRDWGALTFVAGGNADACNNMTGYDNLIFVSGTDGLDQRWRDTGLGIGSTYGPYIDLAAPAKDIVVADPTLLPNGYGLHQGTSFATALATGAAALAWSINPGLTADEVRDLLYSTAVDLGTPGWDEEFGHGRIDIGAVAAGAYATIPEPATLGLVFAGLALVASRRRRR